MIFLHALLPNRIFDASFSGPPARRHEHPGHDSSRPGDRLHPGRAPARYSPITLRRHPAYSRRPVRLRHPLLTNLHDLIVAHGDPEHRAVLMR